MSGCGVEWVAQTTRGQSPAAPCPSGQGTCSGMMTCASGGKQGGKQAWIINLNGCQSILGVPLHVHDVSGGDCGSLLWLCGMVAVSQVTNYALEDVR